MTELETEVMRIIWDNGACSVEAVHQVIALKRKLKETSVRTILRRLEQKGYLRHEEKQRAYIYFAVEPARSLAGRAIRQILNTLCRGSVEELVSGMVDAKVLSQKELDGMAQMIRRRSRGGKNAIHPN